MFCKYCGEKIEDGGITCSKCGKSIKMINTNKIIDFFKSKKGLIVCVGIILIIGMIISLTTQYTTIDMKDLYTVEFSGLDGNGKATVELNEQAWNELFNNLAEDDTSDDILLITSLTELEYTLSQKENLSNGDKIILKINFPEEFFKNFDIKAKNLEQEIKVTDLIVPEEINVFEGLKVEFSGRSPFIICDIINNDCNQFTKKYVRFETDKKYYAIGEKVVVMAYCDDEDLEDAKVKLEKVEAEYDVQGQEYYIDALDGVDTTEMIKDMRNQLELEYEVADELFCGVELGWTNHFTDLKSEQKNGALFLVLDDYYDFEEETMPYNIYALCYKTKIGVEHRSKGHENIFETDVEILLLVKNLYIDENNVLHYDDKIEVIAADTEEIPNYKSSYIKDKQDLYSIQELSTN